MGGLDWWFSMVVMWIANINCMFVVRYFARSGDLATLSQLWWALAAFMGTQVVAGVLRYESKTGVWKALKKNRTR